MWQGDGPIGGAIDRVVGGAQEMLSIDIMVPVELKVVDTVEVVRPDRLAGAGVAGAGAGPSQGACCRRAGRGADGGGGGGWSGRAGGLLVDADGLVPGLGALGPGHPDAGLLGGLQLEGGVLHESENVGQL